MFFRNQEFSSPCNFATTHLTACNLDLGRSVLLMVRSFLLAVGLGFLRQIGLVFSTYA